jgi:ABC-type Fe3+/spermidine/putrescine transport system ATPase subunit
MSISDRLLVLHEGIIQQIGSPIEIYEHPANEFIAGFVGYVNFLEGTVDVIDEKTKTSYVTTEYGKLELDHDQEDIKVGDEILLVIRPETVSLSPSHGTERPNTFHGTVRSQMYAGNLAKYKVKFGNQEMVVDHYNPMGSQKFNKNDKVKVTVPRSIHVLKRSK